MSLELSYIFTLNQNRVRTWGLLLLLLLRTLLEFCWRWWILVSHQCLSHISWGGLFNDVTGCAQGLREALSSDSSVQIPHGLLSRPTALSPPWFLASSWCVWSQEALHLGSAPRAISLESHTDLQNHWQNRLNWEMSPIFQQRLSLSLWFGNFLTLTELCFLIPSNCFSQTCLSICFLTDLFVLTQLWAHCHLLKRNSHCQESWFTFLKHESEPIWVILAPD